MKIGDIEGTPEEIKGLFQNDGLDLAQFLKAKPVISNPKSHIAGLIASVSVFLIINGCIWIAELPDYLEKIFIILSIALIAIMTILIHQKYEKITISGFTVFFAIVIMSTCLGYITPKEALNKIEKQNPLTKDKKEEKNKGANKS